MSMKSASRIVWACGVVLAACHGGGKPADVGYDLSALVGDSALPHDASMRDESGDDLAAPLCDAMGSLGTVTGVSNDAGDAPFLDGEWHFANGCATSDALFQLTGQCATMTFQSVQVTDDAYGNPPYGLLTFAGDTSFTRASHAGIVASVFAPTICTTGAGNCSVYATDLKTQFEWLDQVVCTTASGGCDCSLEAAMSISDSGSYGANGDALTMQGQAGGAQQFTFGADASTLRIRGGTSAVRGSRGITYVLTR
jgi:hypothetical protein